MVVRAEQQLAELLELVIERVRSRLEPERASIAEEFVRQFYSNVPPDDICHTAPDNLYGAALALLGLASDREIGVPKIRVYNPHLEEHGWKASHTVVEIVNDDMPFLVDSITAALGSYDAEVHLVIHPVFRVSRDQNQLTAIHPIESAPKDSHAESIMHVQISEQAAELLPNIESDLGKVLADVRSAVTDWKDMRQRCQDLADELEKTPPALPQDEIAEGIAFLRWAADDHFTYLGYREYSFSGKGSAAVAKITPESGLGILRNKDIVMFDGLRNLGKLPEEVRHFVRQPELLRITKANHISTVHRRVHLDTIAVKCFDSKGNVTGERLFAGLFTSVAYSRSPSEIPLLRQKVSNSLARAGFQPSSHDGKALTHILETYPRDDLFQIDDAELYEIAKGILHLQERQRVALFMRRDAFERFVSSLVYVPRDRYDTNLRIKFQAILEESLGGHVTAFYTHLGDTALARIHFIVKTTPGKIPEVDVPSLEQKLVEASRSWVNRLEEAVIDARGEEQGIRCMRRFARAFPVGYQDHFNEQAAVFDIARIEHTMETGDIAMNLYRPIEARDHKAHFKIYVEGESVPLSDVLPMIENMGLRVMGERPFEVRPTDAERTVWIQDFVMVSEDNSPIELSKVRDAFHEAFGQVWRRQMENDGFNKLVVRAGLVSREVTVVRAYCKYLRQARIPFSQAYMEGTLKNNPHITRLLVNLFQTRFDPAKAKGSSKACAQIKSEILGLLEEVSNLDEDRIIRRFLNVIEATLRTNFYQMAEDGSPKSYISFKLDSRRIDELPLPRPFREIFVYSPQIEGVHLRFGMVARGGLRWSDRLEDFRTEILGLVKAQQVKNSVIVPVGSKGGFVVKQPPAPEEGREAFLNAGIACYKTFISGLLDVTDNLKGGDVVPPRDVVRRDDDDPYLVVAADKGTATFSDIANGVSVEYGHWLDDAFASGGSAGYDHKKMGITARGAWESVKRHFREIGKDIQNEDFTCIGIGDMGGDVFGNGMLLSKHIRLIGAFNHLHIFVDPNPDAAKSWKERKRLFDLPRSAWTDYNAKLISKGGGVFDRRAKSITLTPEMKKSFGIEGKQVTPNELIKAMLKSDVELLWFGGIGTYIKAAEETDADAGDRANDALRINGRDLRAKVVGEGANLGLTQRGRIEYGSRGGRLNTDSIDNSAGVDCSDHEVNIKILLGDVEQAGDMTRKQRDKLLEEMTDEVAELVLRDNYLQSQAITVTHQLGAHLLDRLARFMRQLEKSGNLDRYIEFLPDDEEISDRMKRGVGLTRPELAVLLSYSKLVLYDEILASGLPDDPYMEADLRDYFPTPLRKNFADRIRSHRLRREIIATVITNNMVNRVGITFVPEVKEKTGMSSEDIARAYLISCTIFSIPELWQAIETLDNKVPASVQGSLLADCGRLVERGTVWFLREARYPLDIAGQIKTFGTGVKAIWQKLDELISDADRRIIDKRTAGYVEQGVPEDLARKIAGLALMSPACDIVRIADHSGIAVETVGQIYFTIGARFGFDWLRRAAGQLPTDSAWDKLAVTAIIDDFYGHQGELTSRMLETAKNGADTDGIIDSWAEPRRPRVARTEQLLGELGAAGVPDLAMLAVANRQLKSMVSS